MNSPRQVATPDVRILVVKMSSLGDLFHALPAVHILKERLHAEVHWVVHSEYTGLVGRFSDVQRVIAFPRRGFTSRAAAFLHELRTYTYDYAFDFQGLLKSALVTRLARTRRRIGPAFSREGAPLFYDTRVQDSRGRRHAVEEALDMVRLLNLPVNEILFPLSLSPAELPPVQGPRIGLVPASRWPTKNWPVQNFIRTVQDLQSQLHAHVFIVGSSADHPLCEEIARNGGNITNACGKTTPEEMTALLAAMDLVVSVDSGPMHAAAASGVPVIALFGPTDPSRTGPWGSNHKVLAATDMDCRPCFSRRCRKAPGTPPCMSAITPAQVVAAAKEILGEKESAVSAGPVPSR